MTQTPVDSVIDRWTSAFFDVDKLGDGGVLAGCLFDFPASIKTLPTDYQGKASWWFGDGMPEDIRDIMRGHYIRIVKVRNGKICPSRMPECMFRCIRPPDHSGPHFPATKEALGEHGPFVAVAFVGDWPVRSGRVRTA